MNNTIRGRLKKHNVANIDRTVTTHTLFHKYKGICQKCNCKTVLGVHPQIDTSATMEHIIPISRGGDHTWDNTTLFCRKCNFKANSKHVEVVKQSERVIFRLFKYEFIIRVCP